MHLKTHWEFRIEPFFQWLYGKLDFDYLSLCIAIYLDHVTTGRYFSSAF